MSKKDCEIRNVVNCSSCPWTPGPKSLMMQTPAPYCGQLYLCPGEAGHWERRRAVSQALDTPPPSRRGLLDAGTSTWEVPTLLHWLSDSVWVFVFADGCVMYWRSRDLLFEATFIMTAALHHSAAAASLQCRRQGASAPCQFPAPHHRVSTSGEGRSAHTLASHAGFQQFLF